MSRTSRIAGIFLLVLLTYDEVYRWVALGRWNWQFRWPVQNDQFCPDIVIGALLMLFILSFLRSWLVGRWACVVLLGLWVGVHFSDWWLPYLQDSTSNYTRYSFYAAHTQILPVIGHHHPPDGGHAVLDFLLYPTWFACLLGALSARASKRSNTVPAR